jgi:ATP-binding cassette subfamily B multidrug efflux pump
MRTLLRLLPWIRPYRWRFTVGLISVVISTALSSLIPTLLRRAIDRLGQPDPWIPVLEIAGLMLAVTLTMAIFRFTMREILNGVSRVIENDLRDALFARLTTLDGAWFGRMRTGEIMARLTNDLTAVRMAVGPAVMYLTNTIFGGLFALGFMIAISPRLTGLALIPMFLLPVVMFRLGKVTHDRFERVQSTFGDLTTLVQEHLAGIRIVRAYAQEQAERARFAELSEAYLHRNRALVRLNGLMNPAFTLLAGLGAAVVLGAGGVMVLEGALTVGTFVAFGLYLSNLTWPLIALGWVTNLVQRGAASWGRIEAILDAHPTITDPVTPRVAAALPQATAGRTISFDGVSFAYPAASGARGRTVLHDVTLTIPAGTTLGVVGATGSGKSALLELLPRLADPTQGVIRLDGVDLRDLPLATLRAEIGFVPQESLLFSETIRDNLHYGTEDDDAVREATRVAQLAETIAGLPQGEQTILGERGVNLSGGQRQRAALARALARRPNVVILDDALAAVDTQTEAEILRELYLALAGRTAIIASHRITAVRAAHWIVVLDEGRIVEQGRHDDLVAAGGRYAALLERQRLEESLTAA